MAAPAAGATMSVLSPPSPATAGAGESVHFVVPLDVGSAAEPPVSLRVSLAVAAGAWGGANLSVRPAGSGREGIRQPVSLAPIDLRVAPAHPEARWNGWDGVYVLTVRLPAVPAGVHAARLLVEEVETGVGYSIPLVVTVPRDGARAPAAVASAPPGEGAVAGGDVDAAASDPTLRWGGLAVAAFSAAALVALHRR
ncbi:MAG: hypothetical protein ACT4PT_06970 [Methanobacteriota archaeon]